MKIHSTLSGVPVGPGQPTRIMGVINVSPESFYSGSIKNKTSIALSARKMEEDGADFIDIGAMSTAPYLKTAISEKEEVKRIAWAVTEVRKACRLPISIDTTRSATAKAGLEAGATIINDISGLRSDLRMIPLLSKAKGLILMAHPSGLSPKSKNFSSPIMIVRNLLKESFRRASETISPSKIVLDPGIGFFRETSLPWWTWDVIILQNLNKLHALRCPLLMGVSRKSFIGHLLGGKKPEDRLYGSLGATVASVLNGASIIRTHDVRETKEAVVIAEQIKGSGRNRTI